MTSGPKLIKELSGHSGSKIYLMEDDTGLFVRKVGNTNRNFERLKTLGEFLRVPKIYNYHSDILDMEYIHGLDIKTYLLSNNTKSLEKFLLKTINTLKGFSYGSFDFTEVYNTKLSWIDSATDLPFTKKELIDRLPKILPKTLYHGDLTLENIIYSEDGFYTIDPVTIEYESYVFDIAKLRQDLECRWFLRKEKIRLGAKLKDLQNKILELYPESNDDNLLILMLLRVYLHTEKNDLNYEFIMKEINRLWK
jgi:RIO-like serine/threonine protein kinase